MIEEERCRKIKRVNWLVASNEWEPLCSARNKGAPVKAINVQKLLSIQYQAVWVHIRKLVKDKCFQVVTSLSYLQCVMSVYGSCQGHRRLPSAAFRRRAFLAGTEVIMYLERASALQRSLCFFHLIDLDLHISCTTQVTRNSSRYQSCFTIIS